MATLEPRKPAQTFRDLVVWQKGHRFALAIYSFTRTFPKAETFGLTSQLRRAAVSIPANIAEGFRKRSDPDKARFVNMAHTSSDECLYYLILAADLGYGDTTELIANLSEISRLLTAYQRALRS